MDTLLSFEKQLLLDTFEDDSLVVVARGLGIDRLFVNYLKLYTDPKLLILVLNTSPQDEVFFISELQFLGVEPLPLQITSELNSNDRQKIYQRGGILFVTCRILIVDMLTDKLPTSLVSGMLVYKAHKLLNSFQESFILRLYRQKKVGGFVKAFTDHPTALSHGGIGQLQKLVSRLYVRKVELIPRFHVNVKKCLDENPPEVIEMRFKLTASMKKIRSSISEIILACLKELSQANPSMKCKNKDGMEESCLSKVVHETELERGLVKECATLNQKTEKLLVDLKYLRSLLAKLETSDAVSFLKSVNMLRDDKKAFSSNVGWLFTSSAAKLFSEAEARLNISDNTNSNINDDCSSSVIQEDTSYEHFAIEVPPKWRALCAVAKEIQETIKEHSHKDEHFGRCLVLTANEYSAEQAYELIINGPAKMCANVAFRAQSLKSHEKRKNIAEPLADPIWDPLLVKLACDTNEPVLRGSKISIRSSGPIPNKSKCKKLGDLEAGQKTLTDLIGDTSKVHAILTHGQNECVSRPECRILPLNDRYKLLNAIHSFRPTFIVFYQSDLSTLREVETFPIRLYFLMYEDSSEEQAYLSALQKEKAAFQFLIQESGTLLNGREYDVARAMPPSMKPEPSARKAGGQTDGQPATSKVIIDMRELRSELPLLVYKRGIDIFPCTLEVGDYVLTPDIVVERKSHSDLVQSLQSGRLYNQVQHMMQHYKSVILLIEGNSTGNGRSGPFGGDLSPGSRDLRSKLTVLTRQCPQLRLVWTQKPDSSAQLFEELKFNEPEPSVDDAMNIRVDEVSTGDNVKPTCRDIVLAIPGVNHKQAKNILQHDLSLKDLCKMNPTDLEKLVNDKLNAQNIAKFLNKQFNPQLTKMYQNVKSM